MRVLLVNMRMFPISQLRKYKIILHMYAIYIVMLAIMMTYVMSYPTLSGFEGMGSALMIVGFFAISAIGIVVLLTSSTYLSKLLMAGREPLKLTPQGFLLLVMAYFVGMTAMSFIEFIFAFGASFFRDDMYGALILPDLILTNLLFVLGSLYFGWLHGKKVLAITFVLVVILFYQMRFDVLRTAYCKELSPTQCGNEGLRPAKDPLYPDGKVEFRL